ncbi:MAG: TPM domain-containing protein [Christensenellales bacterium]
MKRRTAGLLLLSLLLVPFLISAQGLQHVVDQAGTFTATQVSALDDKLDALYDKYGFDVVIVTTNDSRGQSAQMYSADFYDNFRSYSDYPNGLIFSFNFDIGEYYEATRGVGMTLFSDSGADQLDSLLRPYLSSRDYYGAMQSYTDYVASRLARASQVDASGRLVLTGKLNAPSLSEAIPQVAGSYLIFIVIAGLVIGLVAALVMRSKLLIAKPQNSAASYSIPGSLSLRDSSDIFLYDTVTRTRIQQNRSSGGGGGGIRFGSSGGNSYGGRGGKL